MNQRKSRLVIFGLAMVAGTLAGENLYWQLRHAQDTRTATQVAASSVDSIDLACNIGAGGLSQRVRVRSGEDSVVLYYSRTTDALLERRPDSVYHYSGGQTNSITSTFDSVSRLLYAPHLTWTQLRLYQRVDSAAAKALDNCIQQRP